MPEHMVEQRASRTILIDQAAPGLEHQVLGKTTAYGTADSDSAAAGMSDK